MLKQGVVVVENHYNTNVALTNGTESSFSRFDPTVSPVIFQHDSDFSPKLRGQRVISRRLTAVI